MLGTENRSLKEKALYNRGNANYRMGKLQDAVTDYEAALKVDPDDEQAVQNLEFVKKMMEMKKNQQHQSSSQGQEKSEAQGKSPPEGQENRNNEQKKAAGRPETNKGGEGQLPEYGRSMAAKPNDDDRQQALSPEKKKASEDQSAAAAEAGPAPDRDQIRQAERMLNRLQDMPGKALMPLYRE
ncbi:MAG: tetratricopeptide repeat protein, partial [Pseudomonadota bacterium]